MLKKSIVLLFAAMLMHGGMSFGQSTFSNAYGNGVHQYFSGRYQEAIMSFNSAIADNQSDARAFYFRGLAQMALGNNYSAEVDFQQGALVETSSSRGRSSLVNRSLERIQGATRLRIEQFRGNTMRSTTATAIAGTPNPYYLVPDPYNQTIGGQEFVSKQFVCQPQIVQRPVYQQPPVSNATVNSKENEIQLGVTTFSNEPVLSSGVSATSTSNPPFASEARGSMASPTQQPSLRRNEVPFDGNSNITPPAVENVSASADGSVGAAKRSTPANVELEKPVAELTESPALSQIDSGSSTTTRAKETMTSEETIDLIPDPAEINTPSATEDTASTDRLFGFETPVPAQPATIEEPIDAEATTSEEPVGAEPTTEAPTVDDDPFGFETPDAEEPASTEEPDEAPATDEPEGVAEDPSEVEATPAEEETDDPADLFE